MLDTINNINNIKFVLIFILIVVLVIVYKNKKNIEGSYDFNQYKNINNIYSLHMYNKNNINKIPKNLTKFHKTLIKEYPIINNKNITYIVCDKKFLDDQLEYLGEYPSYSDYKIEIINKLNNNKKINNNDSFKKYWGKLTKDKCISRMWGDNLDWGNVPDKKYYELIIFLWSLENYRDIKIYHIISQSMWKYKKIHDISYSLDIQIDNVTVYITQEFIKLLIDGLNTISKMGKFNNNYPMFRNMIDIDTLIFGKLQKKMLNNQPPTSNISTISSYTIDVDKINEIKFYKHTYQDWFGSNIIYINNNNSYPIIPFSLTSNQENEIIVYPKDNFKYKFENYFSKKNKLILSITDNINDSHIMPIKNKNIQTFIADLDTTKKESKKFLKNEIEYFIDKYKEDIEKINDFFTVINNIDNKYLTENEKNVYNNIIKTSLLNFCNKQQK